MRRVKLREAMDAYRHRTGTKLTYELLGGADRHRPRHAAIAELRAGYNTRLSTIERLCRALEDTSAISARCPQIPKGAMRLDNVRAAKIVREQAARLASDQGAPQWITKVERLSKLCEAGDRNSTSPFSARPCSRRRSIFGLTDSAIKPTHAKDNPNAFSARTLCHSVLVPLAAQRHQSRRHGSRATQ